MSKPERPAEEDAARTKQHEPKPTSEEDLQPKDASEMPLEPQDPVKPPDAAT